MDFLVVKNRSKSFALHSGTNGTMRDALADDQPFEISLLLTEIDALLIPRRFASDTVSASQVGFIMVRPAGIASDSYSLQT